jgi:hypothetical protein
LGSMVKDEGMKNKNATSLADLILETRMGKITLPDTVDREEFAEFLEKILATESAAIARSDRIFSRRQALIITISTIVLAACAVATLIMDFIKC